MSMSAVTLPFWLEAQVVVRKLRSPTTIFGFDYTPTLRDYSPRRQGGETCCAYQRIDRLRREGLRGVTEPNWMDRMVWTALPRQLAATRD